MEARLGAAPVRVPNTPFGDVHVRGVRFELDAEMNTSLSYRWDRLGVRIRLWYDSKTYALLKRTIGPETEAAQPWTTEAYEQCELNRDLDDELFRIEK